MRTPASPMTITITINYYYYYSITFTVTVAVTVPLCDERLAPFRAVWDKLGQSFSRFVRRQLKRSATVFSHSVTCFRY